MKNAITARIKQLEQEIEVWSENKEDLSLKIIPLYTELNALCFVLKEFEDMIDDKIFEFETSYLAEVGCQEYSIPALEDLKQKLKGVE